MVSLAFFASRAPFNFSFKRNLNDGSPSTSEVVLSATVQNKKNLDPLFLWCFLWQHLSSLSLSLSFLVSFFFSHYTHHLLSLYEGPFLFFFFLFWANLKKVNIPKKVKSSSLGCAGEKWYHWHCLEVGLLLLDSIGKKRGEILAENIIVLRIF